jgi:hypothetical protein
MEEQQIEFVFVPPSFGKKNPTLATLNNVSKWWKFAKTKMKDNFITELSEWSLPPWEDNPYTKAEIEYTILRKDGKKIDSDNLAFSYKWLQDLLVENQYMTDDDKIRVVLNPTRLHVEGSVETSVHVTIRLYERYVMTVDELKELVDNLQEELKSVDGDGHVKASSLRVRKMLIDIKNATPQLRRDLLALDGK